MLRRAGAWCGGAFGSGGSFHSATPCSPCRTIKGGERRAIDTGAPRRLGNIAAGIRDDAREEVARDELFVPSTRNGSTKYERLSER